MKSPGENGAGSISLKKPKRKTRNQHHRHHHHNLETNSSAIFALMLAALHAAAASTTTTTTTTTNDNKTKMKKKNYDLGKRNSYHRLLLQLLNQLRLSLFSKTPNFSSLNQIITPQLTLPVPILSLLPPLLTSKCAEVVCKCAEFVGAASLFSLEMNEQIASDGETVKGLVFVLARSKGRDAWSAACNAVLDMSTALVGRQRLVESSALDCLMVIPYISFIGWAVLHLEGEKLDVC